MNVFYVKLVGEYYKLNCVIREQRDDMGILYINQYGGVYRYIEKDSKKYLKNGNDLLEIVHMEKIQGAIILEPNKTS